MEVAEGYKDTKIGKIPKDWEEAKLTDVIDLIHGHQFRDYDFVDNGIPIVKIGSLIDGKGISFDNATFVDVNKLNDFKQYLLKEGDVLMALTGATLGKVSKVDTKKTILQNYRVGKFIPKNSSIDNIFLYHILQSHLVQTKMWALINQGAQPNIGKADFRLIHISLPPSKEQQKIAEILSTLDEQISTTQAIIYKSKELKKGLMQKLFSEGIGHTEFKDTKIGRIPKDWEVKKVLELCDVKGGKRVPKGHSLSDVKTDYPYIRVADMSMMKVYVGNLLYLQKDTQELIKRYVISKDDVFVSVAGTVGIVGVIPSFLDGANLTENADKLCNLKNINQLFLAYLLSSHIGQKQIESYIGVGAQPKLALKRLQKILVPTPSLFEQQKIAEILSEADAKIEKEEQEKAKLEELKKGLMQQLLTGKKRVKV